MKIKVPTKVDLNGFLVEVKYFPLLKEEERLCGQFKGPNIVEVALAEHKSKAELMATIMHELFHAVFERSGIGHMLSGDMEEGIVRALENHLGRTLKFDTKSWLETKFVEITNE